MKRTQAITTYQLGKVYVFARSGRQLCIHAFFAVCAQFCFASKLFGVLISLHICSSMPMVHVYYLSKATHT